MVRYEDACDLVVGGLEMRRRRRCAGRDAACTGQPLRQQALPVASRGIVPGWDRHDDGHSLASDSSVALTSATTSLPVLCKVKQIIRGDVVSEVDVETPWDIVTSVITTRSVDDLFG